MSDCMHVYKTCTYKFVPDLPELPKVTICIQQQKNWQLGISLLYIGCRVCLCNRCVTFEINDKL